jgi:hypothetical protein
MPKNLIGGLSYRHPLLSTYPNSKLSPWITSFVQIVWAQPVTLVVPENDGNTVETQIPRCQPRTHPCGHSFLGMLVPACYINSFLHSLLTLWSPRKKIRSCCHKYRFGKFPTSPTGEILWSLWAHVRLFLFTVVAVIRFNQKLDASAKGAVRVAAPFSYGIRAHLGDSGNSSHTLSWQVTGL